MHSPAHPDTELEPKEIEPGLSAYVCPKSGGIWIPLPSYLEWQAKQKGETGVAPKKPVTAPAPAEDAQRKALFCPESGRLMIRYKVGQGFNFHIEVSPVTGGVWLEKGEWEALKSKGLHVALNHIFTASYQRKVRAADYLSVLDQAFRDRIGQADFKKISDFKAWLDKHPKRADICHYLSNDGEDNTTTESKP